MPSTTRSLRFSADFSQLICKFSRCSDERQSHKSHSVKTSFVRVMKLIPTLTFILVSAFNGAFAHNDEHPNGGRALNGYFPCGTTTHCVSNRATCENNSVCRCLDGYSGPTCQPEDECATSSPCVENARCSDYLPPQKFKCSCVSGTTPVLPNAADVTDPVPAAWRPLSCVKEEPEVATSPVSIPPVLTASPILPPPPPATLTAGSCDSDADCDASNLLKCDTSTSKCVCPFGYVKVGGACQLENECQSGFPNVCHRNAICTNNPSTPGYSCACASGFVDVNLPAVDQTGTNCAQENECSTGTHNCPSTKTCVDRVPPQLFDCIEPTPAPTEMPTPLPTEPVPLPTPNP